MLERIRTRSRAIVAAAALAASTAGGIAVAGCGGGSSGATSAMPAQSTIPNSLRTVEGGAEDTVDFALAGDRAKATAAANSLNKAAQGQAATDLAAAGVPAQQIRELQERAAGVAGLAPGGNPVDVALAANRTFELVPGFLARFSDPVPAEVIQLDYLDFEVKVQSIAGNREAAAKAAAALKRLWSKMSPRVVASGGESAARGYSAHVKALDPLLAKGTDEQIAAEAQNGLDLVDQIEAVYTG